MMGWIVEQAEARERQRRFDRDVDECARALIDFWLVHTALLRTLGAV